MAKVSDEGKRLFNEVANEVSEGTGNDLKRIQEEYPLSSGFKGKSRVVWEITDPSLLEEGSVDDVVVKFPMDSTGEIENDTEISEWRNLPDEVKEHLADLHDWDTNGDWILQEKVETSQSIQKELLSEVRDSFIELGYRFDDIKSSDIGVNDEGDPVLVDWGEGATKFEQKSISFEQSISNFSDLEQELKNETFAIITAEAPKDDVDISGNPQKQLKEDLKELNPDEIRQISGQYDGVQESPFYVSGISGHKEDIIRLGHKYGQESIIWGNGGVFQMVNSSDKAGKVMHTTSDIVEVEGNENFSRMFGEKFRFDFDF